MIIDNSLKHIIKKIIQLLTNNPLIQVKKFPIIKKNINKIKMQKVIKMIMHSSRKTQLRAI